MIARSRDETAVQPAAGALRHRAGHPAKSNQKRPKGERFDKKTYRKRSRVEQAVGSLKECRRLATRYEKLGLNFLAFVKLGIMLKYLRVLIH